MTVIVEVPLALKNPLNASYEHWAVKAKRARSQRAAIGWTLRAARVHDNLPVCPWPLVVTMTRVYAGRSKAMDDDGLSASFKHTRDAVAAYMGIDDADKRIRFVCLQERGPKASKASVRIVFSVGALAALGGAA